VLNRESPTINFYSRDVSDVEGKRITDLTRRKLKRISWCEFAHFFVECVSMYRGVPSLVIEY